MALDEDTQDEDTGGDDRRRSPRRTVIWRADASLESGERKLWVRNISAVGMALQSESPLPLHAGIVVRLEKHGVFEGRIVWAQDSLYGMAFAEAPEVIIERFGSEAATLGMAASG
jgi:hypothetical protein